MKLSINQITQTNFKIYNLFITIYVPDVDGSDHTRPKHFYDATYEFLRACGVKTI